MRKSPTSSKRERYGLKDLLTDLTIFVVIGAVAVFGIHKWNAMLRRPLGMPRVPVMWIVDFVPQPLRPILTPGHARIKTDMPVPPSRPKPSASPSPSPTAAATPTPAPTQPSPTPAPTAAEAPQAAPSPEPVAVPQPPATVTTLAPNVSASANPLQAAATALYRWKSAMYIGLPDGGVAFTPEPGKPGKVVRLPQSTGAVKAIAISGDGNSLFWITEGAAQRFYSFQTKTGSLRAFDLPASVDSGVVFDTVATLPAHDGVEAVAVLSKGHSIFFDAKSGKTLSPGDVLPSDAADAVNRPETTLFVARDPSSTAILLLSGDGVASGASASIGAWTIHSGSEWTRHQIDTTAGPAYNRLRFQQVGRGAVSLTTTSFAMITPAQGGQTLSAGTVWSGSLTATDTASQPIRTQPTLAGDTGGLWAAPERVAIGGSGLWWTFANGTDGSGSTTLFHATPTGGRSEAYLPWNGAGNKHIAALIADDTGIWAATDTGVKHIVYGKPTVDAGYGGYVKVRLGTDAGTPPSADHACQTLAHLTQDWQGTPYKWGGDSRAGIDCSGYVSVLYKGVGVNVPRATQELAGDGSGGKRIRDELRYGDVLVFPGHCALYTGNGWTSEARTDVGVAKATIWGRKQVVVRRFLKS